MDPPGEEFLTCASGTDQEDRQCGRREAIGERDRVHEGWRPPDNREIAGRL